MIIGLSGKIASGKSTTAKYLGEKYNFRILKTNAFLKTVLKTKAVKVDRANLQLLGEQLISVMGAPGFVATILEYLPEDNYIIDSIRYVEAVGYLRKKYKNEYLHLHMVAENKNRRLRMKPDDRKNFDIIEKAGTERGNEQLRQVADKTIINNGTLNDLYIQIDVIMSGQK
jgi:dephospho-CoA kinase